MDAKNCDCSISCISKSLIASIVIGVLAAIFRYSALITVTPAFLWVLLGVAVGFLGITLLSSSSCCSEEGKSCCHLLKFFLAGILGTSFTSVLLLGITFAATSFLGALITGVLLFFFSLLISSATCLISCRYNCN